MQSRSNQPAISCCTVEPVSSDSDFVDITSVRIHHATNYSSDELAEDYVYDDDDDDEYLFAGVDSNGSRQALLTSVVRTDVSDIPSANGIVDVQSPSNVTGRTRLPPPPYGFPLRSKTEIMSHTVELLDTHLKHRSEDCAGNNNNMQHDNVECFKHTVSSVCHMGDSNSIVQTAESVHTSGKSFHFSVLPASIYTQ